MPLPQEMFLDFCTALDCYQHLPCRTHNVKRVLVTGGNKGIGYAIVEALLREYPFQVLLGSRDKDRGMAALLKLIESFPAAKDRVSVLPLDVSSDQSVQEAYDGLRRSFPEEKHPLYGIICNAGAGDKEQVFEVNIKGTIRVCETLLPLLKEDRGRLVVVTSAAGPIFVSKCSPERRLQFVNPDATLEDILALTKACESATTEIHVSEGFGSSPDAYGMSKALANLYVQHLSRRFPNLKINACTPGLIETDLLKAHLPEMPEEQRATMTKSWKQPMDGARSSVFLMTSEKLEGNGRYYGSDCKRSPLDRYRSPEDPEYKD